MERWEVDRNENISKSPERAKDIDFEIPVNHF